MRIFRRWTARRFRKGRGASGRNQGHLDSLPDPRTGRSITRIDSGIKVGYLMNERGGITAVQKRLGHRNIAYSAGYCQRADDELAGYLERKGRLAM
jgi:hypothetical protein